MKVIEYIKGLSDYIVNKLEEELAGLTTDMTAQDMLKKAYLEGAKDAYAKISEEIDRVNGQTEEEQEKYIKSKVTDDMAYQ